MASTLVEWMRVGKAVGKDNDPTGLERAQHAARIVSVLDCIEEPGKVEELRRIAVEGGFLSATLRYCILQVW